MADLKRDYTTGNPQDAIIMAIAVSKISKKIFSTKFRRLVALLYVLSNTYMPIKWQTSGLVATPAPLLGLS